MPDFLQSLEPYTSYRYILALVLGGLTLFFVVSGLIELRQLSGLLADFNRMAGKGRVLDEARLAVDPGCDLQQLPTLKAKPGRVVKLMLLLVVLRQFRLHNLLSLAPELVAIVLLGAGCVWSLEYVFTLGA